MSLLHTQKSLLLKQVSENEERRGESRIEETELTSECANYFIKFQMCAVQI